MKKKINHYKRIIRKIASDSLVEDEEYLKDIKCEVCKYEGKPSYAGFCPECGALGGLARKGRDNRDDYPLRSLVSEDMNYEEYAFVNDII